MDHVELRVVLLEEHGLGRITVGLEEYFDFSFSLSDELEQLEHEFGDIPACGWERMTPKAFDRGPLLCDKRVLASYILRL